MTFEITNKLLSKILHEVSKKRYLMIYFPGSSIPSPPAI